MLLFSLSYTYIKKAPEGAFFMSAWFYIWARKPRRPQKALMTFSTIFLASENSIIVLSRKNNSFSTPA